MWVKQCQKPPMSGNGKHSTYKNGDDWGMVYGIVLRRALFLYFHKWGYPNSWMVYFMGNPSINGWFRGTSISGNIHTTWDLPLNPLSQIWRYSILRQKDYSPSDTFRDYMLHIWGTAGTNFWHIHRKIIFQGVCLLGHWQQSSNCVIACLFSMH